MHKKDLGIPRRQNRITIKKMKGEKKNRIEQTPKTRENKKNKTLALEKQQEVPLIRMEKRA